ncbi:hypothetical protein NA57DRAFT_70582 [Rhizodiscina lignyota]|uniref:Uncharacterized protein n=1 Tax=Rhizodiscina lignyota TaxID=1504668 RepID=A0A9P4IMQ6_9PEZI|nr:hypothetical protein NA57DRAFT_70582 [Rhizodiscina lignyota]
MNGDLPSFSDDLASEPWIDGLFKDTDMPSNFVLEALSTDPELEKLLAVDLNNVFESHSLPNDSQSPKLIPTPQLAAATVSEQAKLNDTSVNSELVQALPEAMPPSLADASQSSHQPTKAEGSFDFFATDTIDEFWRKLPEFSTGLLSDGLLSTDPQVMVSPKSSTVAPADILFTNPFVTPQSVHQTPAADPLVPSLDTVDFQLPELEQESPVSQPQYEEPPQYAAPLQYPVAPFAPMVPAAGNNDATARYYAAPFAPAPMPPTESVPHHGSVPNNDRFRLLSDDSNVPRARSKKTKKSHLNFRAEKPSYDPKHVWVRVNESTAGTSSRSGKLNQYDASDHYEETDAFPDWSYDGCKFRYNEHGELQNSHYTAHELETFFLKHDEFFAEEHGKLRLYIQKTPADSARRYPSKESSLCRFAECPLRQINKAANIWQGHLRVAIDERWNKYRAKTDPFYVAGYVHLYCLERFLDLPKLAKAIEIKIDRREFPKTEPLGKFAAMIAKDDARYKAGHEFLRAIEKDNFSEKFPMYPVHYETGAPKNHEDTLNYKMQKACVESWSVGKRRQMDVRQSATQLSVTFGDLDLFIKGKWPKLWEKQLAPRTDGSYPTPKTRKPGKPRKRTRDDDDSDSSDSDSLDTTSDIDSPPAKKIKMGKSRLPRHSNRLARKQPHDYSEP